MKLRLTRVALLAAAIILMMLPACGGGAPATPPASSPSPAATPSAASAAALLTPATSTAMAPTVAASATTPAPTPALTPTAAGAATPAGAIMAGTPGIAATFAPPPSPALPTLAPTPVAPPPAAPTPTAVAIDQAPPTDGPVRVAIMPSRDHFAATLRIADVAPEGYNTIPPTSGRHWDAWSACGFYNYPLPDELLVHNLEHGNIVISYNLADDAEVAELRAAVAAVPLAAEFAIVRRYPRLPPGMVALAAWGALDRMLGVDAGRIAGFFEQYPGTAGPEFPNGLPCTTGVRMTPSSGG